MRHRVSAIVLLLLLSLSMACSERPTESGTATAPPETAPATAGMQRDQRARHTLTVVISNQSFAIPSAHVAVTIDGDPVVNDRFPVETQHLLVSHPFELPQGEHTVMVTSDDGAAPVTVPVDLDRDIWVTVFFWYYPGEHDRPFLEWNVSGAAPVIS